MHFSEVSYSGTSSFLVNRPSTNTHEQTLQTTPESTINVCQLPDSRRQLTSGGCNFNNGTCGYDFPTGLWSQHTESAGAITFGNVDDDDNGMNIYTFSVPTEKVARYYVLPSEVLSVCPSAFRLSVSAFDIRVLSISLIHLRYFHETSHNCNAP